MNSTKTESNAAKTLSDTELLYSLASQVEEILTLARENVHTHGQQHERVTKILDHIDIQIHEIHQFIEENRPHIARAVGFLDPGQAVRAYLSHRKGSSRHGG